MFFKNYEDQKIYICKNKLWEKEIIKYIKSFDVVNMKYKINIIQNNDFMIRIYEEGLNKFDQITERRTSGPNKGEIYIFIKSRNLPLINHNYKYYIEVEKKYDINIKKYKFNIDTIYDFFEQMVYCQMNLFAMCHLLHNNIHEGNIFVEEKDNEENIIYKNIDRKIISKNYFILSDFTKCIVYGNYNFPLYEDKDYYSYSLLKNLEDTAKLTLILFNELKFNVLVSDELKNKYNDIIKPYIENNDEYVNKCKELNLKILELCWNYINPILNKIKMHKDNK